MKNKLLAILILFITLMGLIFYYHKYLSWKKIKEKEPPKNPVSEKQISLKKLKENNYNNKEEKTKKLTAKEKIENLKKESKYYKIINFQDKKFYFTIEGEELNITNNSGKNIWNFPITLKNNIKIKNIYPSKEKYLLSLNQKKYIFNLDWKILAQFNFKIDIDYIKENKNNYMIKTKKWVFLYNKNNAKISYFNMFKDFIIYNNAYIAIIKKDEKIGKKYFINDNKKDIIFYYNPETKEEKIILKSDFDLTKIFEDKGDIYFENKLWEIFKLENY